MTETSESSGIGSAAARAPNSSHLYSERFRSGPRTGCAFHRQGGSAPNGTIQDTTEYWSAGKAYYDPAKITAPTLLVLAEWDNDTPPYMAQTLFPLLVNSPDKRLVMLAEGAHGIIMEKNRLKLFEAVQSFLDEAGRS
jgi:alpha-beta hydrolase superfamily lysophospholipase